MPTETVYKRKLRKLFAQYWSEAYETRSGSGFGYPDLQFLVHGLLIGVEVKSGLVGDLGSDIATIYPNMIRPAQITWHDRFKKAGGKSYIVTCTGTDYKMSAWSLASTDREYLANWKTGFPLKDCTQWVDRGQLVIDLADLK